MKLTLYNKIITKIILAQFDTPDHGELFCTKFALNSSKQTLHSRGNKYYSVDIF